MAKRGYTAQASRGGRFVLRRRAAVTLSLALAVLVAACGSAARSATPCPPQVVAGGSMTPAQARASVVEVTACPTHPSAEDPCYASTGWAIGGGYVVTAGHVVVNGPLGPYLPSGAEPATIRRTDLHVVVEGQAPVPATAITIDVQKSDLGLLRVAGLRLPGLAIASQAAAAGAQAVVVCDAATLQHLSPPPPTDTFSGAATSVQATQSPGPPRVFDVTGSGTPPGCSGAPVIAGNQVVGSLFAGSGNGQPGSGDATVIPSQDVLSVLHLGSLTAACAGLQATTPSPTATGHVGRVLWVVDDGTREHIRVASDVTQAREVATLPENTTPLDAAGNTLAAVYPDGTLHLIDLASGSNRAVPGARNVSTFGGAFNPASSKFAFVSSTSLAVVDVHSGTVATISMLSGGGFDVPQRWTDAGLITTTIAGSDVSVPHGVERIDPTTGEQLSGSPQATGFGNQISRTGVAGAFTDHQPSDGDAENQLNGGAPATNTVRYYRLGQTPTVLYQELFPDDYLSVLAISPDSSLVLVRDRQRVSNYAPVWRPAGVVLVTSAGERLGIDPDTQNWDYEAGDFAGSTPVAGGMGGQQAQLHALLTPTKLGTLDRVFPATSVLLVRSLAQ